MNTLHITDATHALLAKKAESLGLTVERLLEEIASSDLPGEVTTERLRSAELRRRWDQTLSEIETLVPEPQKLRGLANDFAEAMIRKYRPNDPL